MTGRYSSKEKQACIAKKRIRHVQLIKETGMYSLEKKQAGAARKEASRYSTEACSGR